jgi:hypothetical protein
MAENRVPLATADSKEAPPTYEDASIQHGAMPVRKGPPPGNKPIPRGPFPLDIPVLNQLKGKRIILASASPRRKQILSTVLPKALFDVSSLTNPDWAYKY